MRQVKQQIVLSRNGRKELITRTIRDTPPRYALEIERKPLLDCGKVEWLVRKQFNIMACRH
jgi:hypothetical protein